MHMKTVAIYPGTFDPFTNGHRDIVARARLLFQQIIIAVNGNPQKPTTFSLSKRLYMVKESTKDMNHVTVDTFTGLLVNYVQSKKSRIIIRGLRAVSDFEYEFQMALMNRNLNRNIETIFLLPDEKYTYLSSSLVKEISRLDGQISTLVPHNVHRELKKLNVK